MRQTNAELAPIFIVGSPRSGTTLVRMMLNAHSRIAIAPETHFFNKFLPQARKRGGASTPGNIAAFWEEFSNSDNYRAFHFSDPERITREVLDQSRDYADILRFLLNAFASRQEKARYGEKTPRHIDHIEEIRSVFPNALVIHVVRDPRAVAASQLVVDWGPDDVYKTARDWRRFISLSDQFASAPWFMEIRYEDVVLQPRASIRRMCDFVGEAFEERMLYYFEDAERFIENGEHWKDNVTKPPDASKLEAWRHKLGAECESRVVAGCYQGMQSRGYLDEAAVPPGLWRRRIGLEAAWWLGRINAAVRRRLGS